MELRLSSTTEIYFIFQDLYIVVNIHASKKSYAITKKRSKKSKKREL